MFSFILITLIVVTVFGYDSIICIHYPKIVILTFGFCFSQLAAKLMNKTLNSSKEFDQDSLSNNTFFLLANLVVLLKELKLVAPLWLDVIIIFGFFLNLLSWLVYLNRITSELSDILGVYRFKMGKKAIKQD